MNNLGKGKYRSIEDINQGLKLVELINMCIKDFKTRGSNESIFLCDYLQFLLEKSKK